MEVSEISISDQDNETYIHKTKFIFHPHNRRLSPSTLLNDNVLKFTKTDDSYQMLFFLKITSRKVEGFLEIHLTRIEIQKKLLELIKRIVFCVQQRQNDNLLLCAIYPRCGQFIGMNNYSKRNWFSSFKSYHEVKFPLMQQQKTDNFKDNSELFKLSISDSRSSLENTLTKEESTERFQELSMANSMTEESFNEIIEPNNEQKVQKLKVFAILQERFKDMLKFRKQDSSGNQKQNEIIIGNSRKTPTNLSQVFSPVIIFTLTLESVELWIHPLTEFVPDYPKSDLYFYKKTFDNRIKSFSSSSFTPSDNIDRSSSEYSSDSSSTGNMKFSITSNVQQHKTVQNIRMYEPRNQLSESGFPIKKNTINEDTNNEDSIKTIDAFDTQNTLGIIISSIVNFRNTKEKFHHSMDILNLNCMLGDIYTEEVGKKNTHQRNSIKYLNNYNTFVRKIMNFSPLLIGSNGGSLNPDMIEEDIRDCIFSFEKIFIEACNILEDSDFLLFCNSSKPINTESGFKFTKHNLIDVKIHDPKISFTLASLWKLAYTLKDTHAYIKDYIASWSKERPYLSNYVINSCILYNIVIDLFHNAIDPLSHSSVMKICKVPKQTLDSCSIKFFDVIANEKNLQQQISFSGEDDYSIDSMPYLNNAKDSAEYKEEGNVKAVIKSSMSSKENGFKGEFPRPRFEHKFLSTLFNYCCASEKTIPKHIGIKVSNLVLTLYDAYIKLLIVELSSLKINLCYPLVGELGSELNLHGSLIVHNPLSGVSDRILDSFEVNCRIQRHYILNITKDPLPFLSASIITHDIKLNISSGLLHVIKRLHNLTTFSHCRNSVITPTKQNKFIKIVNNLRCPLILILANFSDNKKWYYKTLNNESSIISGDNPLLFAVKIPILHSKNMKYSKSRRSHDNPLIENIAFLHSEDNEKCEEALLEILNNFHIIGKKRKKAELSLFFRQYHETLLNGDIQEVYSLLSYLNSRFQQYFSSNQVVSKKTMSDGEDKNNTLNDFQHLLYMLRSEPGWCPIGRLHTDITNYRAYMVPNLCPRHTIITELGNSSRTLYINTAIQIVNATNVPFKIVMLTPAHNLFKFTNKYYMDTERDKINHYEIICEPETQTPIPLIWFASNRIPFIFPILNHFFLNNINTNNRKYFTEDFYTQDNCIMDKTEENDSLPFFNQVMQQQKPKNKILKINQECFSSLKKLFDAFSNQDVKLSEFKVKESVIRYKNLLTWNILVNNIDTPTDSLNSTAHQFILRIMPYLTIHNLLPFPMTVEIYFKQYTSQIQKKRKKTKVLFDRNKIKSRRETNREWLPDTENPEYIINKWKKSNKDIRNLLIGECMVAQIPPNFVWQIATDIQSFQIQVHIHALRLELTTLSIRLQQASSIHRQQLRMTWNNTKNHPYLYSSIYESPRFNIWLPNNNTHNKSINFKLKNAPQLQSIPEFVNLISLCNSLQNVLPTLPSFMSMYENFTITADISRKLMTFSCPYFIENALESTVLITHTDMIIPPHTRLYISDDEARNIRIRAAIWNSNNVLMLSSYSSKLDLTSTTSIHPPICLLFRITCLKGSSSKRWPFMRSNMSHPEENLGKLNSDKTAAIINKLDNKPKTYEPYFGKPSDSGFEQNFQVISLGSAVRYADAPYTLSKVITIMPRYILVSRLPFAITVCSISLSSKVGTKFIKSQQSYVTVKPNTQKEFHTKDTHCFLQIYGNINLGSRAFSLAPTHVPDNFQVQMNNPMKTPEDEIQLIQVNITSGHFYDRHKKAPLPYTFNSLFIIFEIPEYPYYEIRNYTRYNLSFSFKQNLPYFLESKCNSQKFDKKKEENMESYINSLDNGIFEEYTASSMNIDPRSFKPFEARGTNSVLRLRVSNVHKSDWTDISLTATAPTQICFEVSRVDKRDTDPSNKSDHRNSVQKVTKRIIYALLMVDHRGSRIINLSSSNKFFNTSSKYISLPKNNVTRYNNESNNFVVMAKNMLENDNPDYLFLQTPWVGIFIKFVIPKITITWTPYGNLILASYITLIRFNILGGLKRILTLTNKVSLLKYLIKVNDSDKCIFYSLEDMNKNKAKPFRKHTASKKVTNQLELQYIKAIKKQAKNFLSIYNEVLTNTQLMFECNIQTIHFDHFLEGDIPVILTSTRPFYIQPGISPFFNFICELSVLDTNFAPILDNITITVSPLSANIDLLVVEQLISFGEREYAFIKTTLQQNVKFPSELISLNSPSSKHSYDSQVSTHDKVYNNNTDVHISMHYPKTIKSYLQNIFHSFNTGDNDPITNLLSILSSKELEPIKSESIAVISVPINAYIQKIQSNYPEIPRMKFINTNSTHLQTVQICNNKRLKIQKFYEKHMKLVHLIPNWFSPWLIFPNPTFLELQDERPVYIKSLRINQFAMTISIRTSDKKISRQVLHVVDALPLDSPYMVIQVGSEKRVFNVCTWAELAYSLRNSYMRQIIRQTLPSAWLFNPLAIFMNLIRGFKALAFYTSHGFKITKSIEGGLCGFRTGFIMLFSYTFGGIFQTLSHFFNFLHKAMGGSHPRPRNILDAFKNAFYGFLKDTFVTPWVALFQTILSKHTRGETELFSFAILILLILRCLICPIFGLCNFFASLTEGFANMLLGDFEQFDRLQEQSELVSDSIKYANHKTIYFEQTKSPNFSKKSMEKSFSVARQASILIKRIRNYQKKNEMSP